MPPLCRAGSLRVVAVETGRVMAGWPCLVAEAERRIRARGRDHAELGVEHDNPRARALDERLGYLPYGEEPAEWDEEDPDGALVRYCTVCTMMRRSVSDR